MPNKTLNFHTNLQQTHQNTNKTPSCLQTIPTQKQQNSCNLQTSTKPTKTSTTCKVPQQQNNNISKTRTKRTLTTLAESSTTLITKQGTSSSIQTFFITKPQIVYNCTQKPYSVNSKNSIQFLRIINLQAKTTREDT